MGSDVFISFAFEDEEVAQKIHDYLKDNGVNCFWCKDIPAGSKYGKILSKTIPESKIFLLLLSSAADASESVYGEAMMAQEAKIMKMPIRLEDITPQYLRYSIAGDLYFNEFINKSFEQALKLLVIDVKKQLAVLISTESITSPAPKGNSKTYTEDTVRFTVQYPAKWISKALDGDPQVLKVSAGADATADTVYVYIIPETTNLSTAVKGLLDNSPVFKQYKVMATIDSSSQFALTSGSVNTAIATELKAKIVIYNFYYYAIGATQGDNSVIVIGSTIGSSTNKALIKQICQSLSFATPGTCGTGIGSTACDFTLICTDGNDFTLSSLRGSKIILNFWSINCGPCRQEMPALQQMHVNYPNLAIICVHANILGSPANYQIACYLTDNQLTLTVPIDNTGQVGRLYNVANIPRTFFLDEGGTIRKIQDGEFGGLSQMETILSSY